MSVGQNRPSESNQDDPKMSDPSPSPHVSSDTPTETGEDEPQVGPSSLPLALVQGLFKLGGVVLLVYLTYFFTMSFANRTPPPAPLSDEQVKLAKKAEELRNQGKTLLSSYGWVNPATKSNVHIPIERAMELLVAEAAVPPAAAVVAAAPAPASGAGTTGTSAAAKPGSPAAGAAPTPVVAVAAPAPAGMPPEEMYRAVCMACHDTDGRGKIVRLAMPSIPDLTDAKWQASRKDAELQHSILEGKDSMINGVKLPLMLPMKDKLALAHTDVKDMVAFMRAFKGGKQVVSATPGATPSAGMAVQVAQEPAVPAAPAATTPSALPGPTSSPTAASPSLSPAPAPTAAASSALVLGQANAPQGPQPAATSLVALGSTTSALRTSSTAPSPANSAKVRAAGEFFGVNCIACHGQDGRGSAVRVAMPVIPDFTTRAWQTSRSNPQLATSILEGKGLLMPPWRGRVTPELAQDLIAFVRTFGPAGSTAPTAANTEFAARFKELQKQFDELDLQVQSLSRP